MNKDIRLPKEIDEIIHGVTLYAVSNGLRFDSTTMDGVLFLFSLNHIRLYKEYTALNKMWFTERIRLGETVATRDFSLSEVGEPFFNGSIERGRLKYSDPNSISENDTILILKEYLNYTLRPGQYQVFSFAPNNVYQHYLAFKRKTTKNNINDHLQIVPFASSYANFLETSHFDKARREDSLIILREFDKTGLAGSTLFIKSMQMLCICDKKVVTYSINSGKRKTFTELHFSGNHLF